ncbi:MAG: hypothetical protein KAJ52_05235 [Sedimentisphaerales bacterium]|nr:hypothetical protein [Sedimentisphaerales bacterium]
MTPASKVLCLLDFGALAVLPHGQTVGFCGGFRTFGGCINHNQKVRIFRMQARIKERYGPVFCAVSVPSVPSVLSVPISCHPTARGKTPPYNFLSITQKIEPWNR